MRTIPGCKFLGRLLQRVAVRCKASRRLSAGSCRVCDCCPGKVMDVVCLHARGAELGRLLSQGILRGARLRVLGAGHAGAVVIGLQGTRVALCGQTAACVQVQEVDL